ncbi:MAG: adenylate kinase [Chloroflexota bacterium]|nr:adenylate kinase [Dehalococcoidia bacterium]MDW8254820.1 adenylate kinase [Chloroflexota bacterium]
MPNVILLGPPGSGKGTQAGALAEALGVIHLSTGELFRDHLRNGTDLGQLAKSYMERGLYVPDEVTVAMVFDRLSHPDAANGAVFDGFPRTLPQAEALDRGLAERGWQVDRAILLAVPDDELIRRLSERWLCRSCGASYNLTSNPPHEEGVCDRDGGPLYQRDDDRPEVVKTRLAVYREQTVPLLDYYRRQGKLIEVDGRGDIATIRRQLLAAAVGAAAR